MNPDSSPDLEMQHRSGSKTVGINGNPDAFFWVAEHPSAGPLEPPTSSGIEIAQRLPGKLITALQLAARCGRMPTAEILLEERAKVSQPAAVTQEGTALQVAAGGGHSLIVGCLLKRGEVNVPASYEEGKAELWVAAEGSHFPIMDCLGAHLNAPTYHKERKTALQAAAGDRHLPIPEHPLGGAEGEHMTVIERFRLAVTTP